MAEMVIFFSEFGQNVLVSSSTWSGDGTFACVQSGFSQMYVIFGQQDRHVFLAVYAFLPSKTAAVYNRLFSLVLSKVESKPDKVILDFELAVINTCRKLIEDVAIEGCLFHWKKAIFTQVYTLNIEFSHAVNL